MESIGIRLIPEMQHVVGCYWKRMVMPIRPEAGLIGHFDLLTPDDPLANKDAIGHVPVALVDRWSI